jgi:hypothetical protein
MAGVPSIFDATVSCVALRTLLWTPKDFSVSLNFFGSMPFFASHSASAAALSVYRRSRWIASKKGRCTLSSTPIDSKV